MEALQVLRMHWTKRFKVDSILTYGDSPNWIWYECVLHVIMLMHRSSTISKRSSVLNESNYNLIENLFRFAGIESMINQTFTPKMVEIHFKSISGYLLWDKAISSQNRFKNSQELLIGSTIHYAFYWLQPAL